MTEDRAISNTVGLRLNIEKAVEIRRLILIETLCMLLYVISFQSKLTERGVKYNVSLIISRLITF